MCFYKQKTAYEERISDWWSDVCSSDLAASAHPCAAKRWSRQRSQYGGGCCQRIVGSAPAALEPTYVQRVAVVGRLKPHSGGADSGRSAMSSEERRVG